MLIRWKVSNPSLCCSANILVQFFIIYYMTKRSILLPQCFFENIEKPLKNLLFIFCYTQVFGLKWQYKQKIFQNSRAGLFEETHYILAIQ